MSGVNCWWKYTSTKWHTVKVTLKHNKRLSARKRTTNPRMWSSQPGHCSHHLISAMWPFRLQDKFWNLDGISYMIQQNQTKNRHISASAIHSAAIYRVTAVKTWTLNVLLASAIINGCIVSPLSSAVSSIGRKVLLRKLHRLLRISLRFIAF